MLHKYLGLFVLFLATAAPAQQQTRPAQPAAQQQGPRDSKISVIEYRSATLANFDRLDTDKDGIVSPAEMKAGGIGR